MATDPEPAETRLLRTQEHIGAVQRWDTAEGMTFRLDLWRVNDSFPDVNDAFPDVNERFTQESSEDSEQESE